MSKKSCELIKDLLPLYADDVCSEESRKIVTEHLAGCEECRAEFDKMKSELNIKERAEKDIGSFKKVKRRLLIGKIIAALIGAFIIFNVCGVMAFNWVNTFVPMDYSENNIESCVSVEQDEDGKVWLVRKGNAAFGRVNFALRASGSDEKLSGPYLDKAYPNLPVMGNNIKEAEKLNLVINLVEPKYEHSFSGMAVFRQTLDKSDLRFNTVRTLITDLNNSDSKAVSVSYYDIENDEDHLLWEKK